MFKDNMSVWRPNVKIDNQILGFLCFPAKLSSQVASKKDGRKGIFEEHLLQSSSPSLASTTLIGTMMAGHL